MRALPYGLWSAAAFFSQYLVVLVAFAASHARFKPEPLFYVIPLRSLGGLDQLSSAMLLAALVYGFLVAWVLAALAFRRAANANVSEWISAGAIVPIIQVAVILLLCVAPTRMATGEAPAADAPVARDGRWSAVVQGLVAGGGATVLAVALGTLVFGTYGYGLFIVSPFVVGAITAYLANRHRDMGAERTNRLVTGAAVLGAIGLVAIALEGVFCIVLASPLGWGATVIGGLLGRSIALARRRPAKQAVYSFAMLPLVFTLESVLPATTNFETLQTITIDAPPEVVWKCIVKMDTIDEPLALPFRLGVAYPVRGEVLGEGVGATRRGEFSTGTADERVTEWIPNRKLAFVVLKDVPAMRELSPYKHVRAPHAIGYFRTGITSFELRKRAGGGTEVVERTSHQLKLDPVFYWLPLAQWIVHENNARVMAHLKSQAEHSRR